MNIIYWIVTFSIFSTLLFGWQVDVFARFIGFKGIFDFIIHTEDSIRWKVARRKLIKKAHLLTYQGLRTLDDFETEFGVFRETEALRRQIETVKHAIEHQQRFELKQVKKKALFRFKGPNGQKLKGFLEDWNKYRWMVKFLKRIGEGRME